MFVQQFDRINVKIELNLLKFDRIDVRIELNSKRQFFEQREPIVGRSKGLVSSNESQSFRRATAEKSRLTPPRVKDRPLPFIQGKVNRWQHQRIRSISFLRKHERISLSLGTHSLTSFTLKFSDLQPWFFFIGVALQLHSYSATTRKWSLRSPICLIKSKKSQIFHETFYEKALNFSTGVQSVCSH